MTVQPYLGSTLAALWGLLLFGIAYAAFVRWLNLRGYMEGYTAIMVVVGVMVTLLINQTIYVPGNPLADLLLEFAGFGASGTPMIVNNIMEYVTRRAQAEQAARDEAQP